MSGYSSFGGRGRRRPGERGVSLNLERDAGFPGACLGLLLVRVFVFREDTARTGFPVAEEVFAVTVAN